MQMLRENIYKLEDKLSNVKVRITSLGLAAIMVVVMGGCTVNRDNDKNPVNNETITTSNIDLTKPNVSPDVKVDVKEEVEVKTPEVKNITYEELIESFDTSIEKFDDATQDYLGKIFSIAYSNADDLLSALSPANMPNKNVFFYEKIVKPLQKIDFFKIVSEEDEDYSDLRQKYTTSRYIKEENGIYMFITGWNQNEQVQIALEEIIHAGQDYLIESDSIDYAIFEILTEGEANLYAWALAFGNINNDSLDFFYFKDRGKDLFQMYGSGHNDHSIASKYYVYLLSLVGFESLDYLKENDVDMSSIASMLTSLYNIDGEKFLKDMADVMVDAACGIDNARTNIMLNVEKTYNDCLLKKISRLDSRKDVIKWIRLYRFINIQLGTRHLEKDSNDNYHDITNKDEFLDRTKIEDILFEKATEFGILDDFVVGLPSDLPTQREIFEKGFVNSPRPEEYGDNFYSIDIFKSKITYKQGNINIENMNGSNCVIPLDENKKVVGTPYEIDIPTYNSGYNK